MSADPRPDTSPAALEGSPADRIRPPPSLTMLLGAALGPPLRLVLLPVAIVATLFTIMMWGALPQITGVQLLVLNAMVPAPARWVLGGLLTLLALLALGLALDRALSVGGRRLGRPDRRGRPRRPPHLRRVLTILVFLTVGALLLSVPIWLLLMVVAWDGPSGWVLAPPLGLMPFAIAVWANIGLEHGGSTISYLKSKGADDPYPSQPLELYSWVAGVAAFLYLWALSGPALDLMAFRFGSATPWLLSLPPAILACLSLTFAAAQVAFRQRVRVPVPWAPAPSPETGGGGRPSGAGSSRPLDS